jgi:capsular exopolysaccharide synthesis family protein
MNHFDQRFLKMATVWNPNSQIAESFKAIRATIDVMNVYGYKSILVTSTKEGEGKSLIAGNLATAFAQSGKNTIYIDCNLRNPAGHLVFHLSNQEGLTNFLLGESKLTNIVQRTDVEKLYVITTGSKVSNSAELITSTKLKLLFEKLTDKADYVIVDSPSLNVADTTSLAAITDASLMIVNINKCTKNEVRKASNQLTLSSNHVLGIVGNE